MTTATEFLADNSSAFWSRNSRGYEAPHPITGKRQRWRRASTVSSMVKETWAIQRWEHRRLVQGMATHPELALRALADFHDDDVLDAVADEGKLYGGSKIAAEMGTALHRIIELHNEGVDQPHLPDHIVARLGQYDEALAGLGLSALTSERIVCLPDLGVMGQFDMILTNGAVFRVGDLKTGADVQRAATEFCIQTAIYSRATHMVNAAGDAWEPMPEVDQEVGYIIHLPSQGEGCVVYEVALEPGWEAVEKLCEPVRKWRSRKGLLRAVRPDEDVVTVAATASVGSVPDASGSDAPSPAGNGDRTGWITGRLHALAGDERARSLIAQRWPDDMTVKPPWTDDQIDALALVLEDVEGKVGADFGASDPTTLPQAELAGLPEPVEFAPSWPIEDTGEVAEPADVEALANMVGFLTSEQQARLRHLAVEGKTYGRPFDGRPMTRRQWMCARAAYAVIAHTANESEVRNLVHGIVRGMAIDWIDTWKVGAVIGSLSIAQAESMADFADAPF